MNKALAIGLVAAIAMLPACQSTSRKEAKLNNPAPCPNVVVLNDAARQVQFDGDEAIENVAWTAEIENVTLNCRYVSAKPIDATMSIDFAFGKGPKADSAEHQYSYWIAVTRTNREVITKTEYFVPVKFSDGKSIERAKHEIKQIVIPRKDESISGVNFEIVVGLAVTPKEATYNRSGKSLKFPDL